MGNLENQTTIKTKSFQSGISSQTPSRRKTSLRIIASLILGAFFLNTVQPVKLAKAEEVPKDYKFKAPQTVSIQSNETKDFNGYDNEINRYKSIIPEDKTH